MPRPTSVGGSVDRTRDGRARVGGHNGSLQPPSGLSARAGSMRLGRANAGPESVGGLPRGGSVATGNAGHLATSAASEAGDGLGGRLEGMSSVVAGLGVTRGPGQADGVTSSSRPASVSWMHQARRGTLHSGDLAATGRQAGASAGVQGAQPYPSAGPLGGAVSLSREPRHAHALSGLSAGASSPSLLAARTPGSAAVSPIRGSAIAPAGSAALGHAATPSSVASTREHARPDAGSGAASPGCAATAGGQAAHAFVAQPSTTPVTAPHSPGRDADDSSDGEDVTAAERPHSTDSTA